MSPADPFGTAAIRERVLAGWAAAPERFREDANAEEDLAQGGYRDRVVVELAQNAADAAVRAGSPGSLLLRLSDSGESDSGVLVAANTGAGLDTAGVVALATLRASAKRPGDEGAAGAATGTVGRFGVGFAAVLAVTDEPSVLSTTGGVRFSRADARALVAELAGSRPGLAAELERREEHVPVLRLPFEASGEPPIGYDTAVLLPLRDGAARDLVEHLLASADDGLLLALPGLAEVAIEVPGQEPRRLADVERRWHVLRRTGRHAASALADRPTEERQRPQWSLAWALPVDAATGLHAVPLVVHAPTPTDEPLAWPALLVATFPLEPTRRHVAPGPATDDLVAAAADAYAALLAERAAAGQDVVALVPVGLPAGRLDAELREAALAALRRSPVLASVETGEPLRPRDAVALEAGPGAGDPSALAALAPVLAGLVAAPRAAEAALKALGVRRVALADLVEQLPAQPDAASWARLYAGLAPLADDAAAREALASLPVPLLDGRVVHGVRGLLLARTDVPPRALALLAVRGLRVVDPAVAVDPSAARLLERLGATPAGPSQVLDAPQLRELLGADPDVEPDLDVNPDQVVDAVLSLVAAALDDEQWPVAGRPWLADLQLPDADGDRVPASLLVQPGSLAADLFDPDAVGQLADDVARRWPGPVWSAVGVAQTLSTVVATDADTTDLPPELADLDGFDDWAAELGPGSVAELAAVRDLDLVADDRWPRALEALATDRALRRAVLDPVVVTAPDGRVRRVTGYTAWWLRRELALSGHAAADGDPELATLLPAAPGWTSGLDADFAAAVGLVRRWSDLDAGAWQQVLQASADHRRAPAVPTLLAMWRALGRSDLDDLDPPDRLWALAGTAPTLVEAGSAVVAESPMWLQRTDVGPAVVAPRQAAERLADLLDLDLAAERAPGTVAGSGQLSTVPDVVRRVLPQAPTTWREHERLLVDGVEVDWWVQEDANEATLNASTLAGLARALAQATDRWDLRLLLESLLCDPASAPAALIEQALTD